MWDLPQPGIKPVPTAVKARSLNHWTTREVLLSKIVNRKARLTIVLAHLGFFPSTSLSPRLLFPVSQCPPCSNNP